MTANRSVFDSDGHVTDYVERARQAREEQGLSAGIEDPATLEMLARIMAPKRQSTETSRKPAA